MAKKQTTQRPGKAGAVNLSEQKLSERELDQVSGGSGERSVMKAAGAESKARSSSAVGMHEISGALVKIN